MHLRISLEPAFALYRRPYGNTSLIVDLLTQRHGRVSVVARSARGLKSRYRGLLQLFTPLLVSWSGKTDLKTLTGLELDGWSEPISGKALLCGFYLNELLQRLLLREDPYPQLFEYYQQTLLQLQTTPHFISALRYFEKNLLSELGYGLQLGHDIRTQQPLQPQQYYQWLPEQGFVACAEDLLTDPSVFLGRSLIALHEECLVDIASLMDAKRLLKSALAKQLGPRPLKSRQLFQGNRTK